MILLLRKISDATSGFRPLGKDEWYDHIMEKKIRHAELRSPEMTAMSTSEMMPSTANPATIFKMVNSMSVMVTAFYSLGLRLHRRLNSVP